MPHSIRPIRPLAILLTAALCLPTLRTAAQPLPLSTCGESASAATYVPETDTLLLTVERLLELGVKTASVSRPAASRKRPAATAAARPARNVCRR